MSLQQDFEIRGGRELDRLLQTLPVKVERNVVRAGLRAGATVFRGEVQQRVPRDDGDLAASVRITSRIQRGKVTVSVKVGNSVAWYAGLVEYGTKPHYIAVSDAERGAGRGIGRRGTAARRETRASMRTVNRRVLQIGANFVGPSVRHPGARPNAFMRPAAEAGLRAALTAVDTRIRQLLTNHGINTPPALPLDPTI